ncbi:MAG: RNA polymerase sigma factor [Gemmatimonadota bacterium]|nr:RNA polymerase sigma factor [Gemmatimonadota bacterium]MDH3368738.1 RNA polymerase sigma factor [Gemmatimonadota bacterium]MDH3477433.1 RNA polymerase sigma factor [Gemmatimonadota bacterium]MDH3569564.1 RNA polymerase sigma factor [Gemmatimonadota bacterium]MDH5549071.1 RNA polymerase sigma factor [Gemmatimonadota bacterium]
MTGRPSAAAAPDDLADARLGAAGDREAFERLYRRHVARIHSLARRMLGEEEADDATQDAFIRAWEKLGTFRGDAAFGTWLHRLAINVMLAARTAAARSQQRLVQGDHVVERAGRPKADLEARMDFESAIATLPAGAREVFMLHDVEGFKHREIAALLGVTAGTSKAQLHRARMALRAYLGGDD